MSGLRCGGCSRAHEQELRELRVVRRELRHLLGQQQPALRVRQSTQGGVILFQDQSIPVLNSMRTMEKRKRDRWCLRILSGPENKQFDWFTKRCSATDIKARGWGTLPSAVTSALLRSEGSAWYHPFGRIGAHGTRGAPASQRTPSFPRRARRRCTRSMY